jgi:type I restriction enzyme S subunit
MLSDKLYRLVPDRSVLPAFLVIVLSGARIQRHLSTVKTGLAESQTNISQDIVRMLLVGLPPIHEQEMIVERMRALNERIEAEQSVVAKLRLMKTGLMDDLLTGRARIGAFA